MVTQPPNFVVCLKILRTHKYQENCWCEGWCVARLTARYARLAGCCCFDRKLLTLISASNPLFVASTVYLAGWAAPPPQLSPNNSHRNM